MAKPIFNIRKMLFDAANSLLGELARDVQKIFNTIQPTEYREMTEFYKEPILLGPFDEEPLCIELARIVSVTQPDIPVECGSLVHYVFKARGGVGNAKITNIDGLTTVGGPFQYKFVFKIVYRAGQNG